MASAKSTPRHGGAGAILGRAQHKLAIIGAVRANSTIACMANHPHAASAGARFWRLTTALDAKLAELRERDLQVLWIESSLEDLTRLVQEGGEDAVRLDPDPSLDRAWYGEVEIRYNSQQADTWVFVRGEVAAGDVSAHPIRRP